MLKSTTNTTTKEAIGIYLSCSPAAEDEELGRKLAEHLRTLEQDGSIKIRQTWDISAGAERENEIKEYLRSSRIILLLISSDYVASDELQQRDVKLAMARHNAKNKEEKACVIPVLLRDYDWKKTQFGHLQALPRNEEPIKRWKYPDEAFKEVAKEIRKVIEGKSDYPSIFQTSKRPFEIPWRSLRTTFLTSVTITFLVIVMRVMGIFEASELLFFNYMMQNQKPEPQDSNLLLVEITTAFRIKIPGICLF